MSSIEAKYRRNVNYEIDNEERWNRKAYIARIKVNHKQKLEYEIMPFYQ